jgi:hypothetical protein
MSGIDVDDLVSSWLIDKWLERSSDPNNYQAFVRYSVDEHGPREALSIVTADADWECGCYSSWTREDDFILQAKIMTASGAVDFEYGRWGDFPSFIEELDAYQRNTVCSYENEADEA